MRLASELGLPLLTVIDTQGAALSPDAENGGLAGEIARCLADLVTLDAPTLCLMLGEGNGGGALALPAGRPGGRGAARLAVAAAAGGRVARSSTATPTTPPRWPGPSRSGRSTCAERGIVDRIVAEKPGRRGRAGGVLPTGGRGAGVRARLAARVRTRLPGRARSSLRLTAVTDQRRTYVVTGAASGIGAATTALLRDEGHRVVTVDLRGADVLADLSTPVAARTPSPGSAG